MYEGYLPISKQDMQERGIKQLDFVYVCGDAYVDHPSFGHAIIARLLEAHGYTVGIIAQPDWKDDASISVLGVPRLGFLVSAGNMDSMVNHYSVSKKRRATDSYTPGGVMGKRPDYATVVYCNLIRHTYKKTPIIIGGIEASLRRLAHYDYWSNKVKRSILLDSGADLISYGMGEHSIIEIADALNAGIDVHDITFIDGTVFKTKNRDLIYDAIELPDYDEIKEEIRSLIKELQAGWSRENVSNTECADITSEEIEVFYQREITLCEDSINHARSIIGDTPIVLDYLYHPGPLGLAKLLLEHGFHVTTVYLDSISPEEKPAFDWLKLHHPNLELRATIQTKMRVLPRGTEGKVLAIGQKAAWFSGSRNFVNMVQGGGLWGFDGIRKTMELMTEAFLEEKDPEDLIVRKGWGCESCI